MNKTFSQQWLNILCSIITEIDSAVFMSPGNKKNHVEVLSRWPLDLTHTSDFTAIFKLAQKQEKQIGIPNILGGNQHPYYFFALPLYFQDKLVSVISIKTHYVSIYRRKKIANLLQQSAQWLELVDFNRKTTYAFYNNIDTLLAPSFRQQSYNQAVSQLVTDLSNGLQCERIAFAEAKHKTYEILALSNSGKSDLNSGLMTKIVASMSEAVDQESIITFPNKNMFLTLEDHHELTAKSGFASLCTIPLKNKLGLFGVITLFRDKENPFDEETIKMAQYALALILPFLELKRNEENSLYYKIKKYLSRFF